MGIDYWTHALLGGGLASAASAVVLVTVLLLAPYTFLSDYPADIRQRAAPPSPRQRRASYVGGAAFLVTLFGSLFAVVFAWGRWNPGAGFVELAAMALVGIVLFTIVDTVIVDWLVVCTWRPQRIVFPGTEECAGWRDRKFHLTEALQPKALGVLVAGSALIGFIAWLTT